jgi:hypothetical protein
MNRIAIIDPINQDIGLKVLFPEADYYVARVEFPSKYENMKHYDINFKLDWSEISGANYDILFIQFLSKHLLDDGHELQRIYRERIEPILNSNTFKCVALFDTYDYDYDPSTIVTNKNINVFFKRNFSKNKTYASNVHPFSFVIFGFNSTIEMMDRYIVSDEEYFKPKENRIFWSGSIFTHVNKEWNVYTDRHAVYNSIQHTLYLPGYLTHGEYLNTIRNSKFSLDLIGIGDPNIKTVEIIISGSLLIAQKKTIKYPFPEEFAEETVFETAEEYFQKMTRLTTDQALYDRCLKQQYDIVKKYLNIPWLRQYIISTLELKGIFQ